MFRAKIYQRSALDEPNILDLGVTSATIKEDKTQKTTSKINLISVPTSVGIGDVVALYNNKGIFVYFGVVNGIDDKTLTCGQFESLWNDNELIVAQTSTNQKAFYQNSTISDIVKFYLYAKSQGYGNIVNTMSSAYVPTFTGLLDQDVADNFKNVVYNITDSGSDHMPYPKEKGTKNLESFLYEIYKTYNRIIRPHFVKEQTPRVPTGYTEVDYLVFSGTQRVLSLIPNAFDKVQIKFRGDSITSSRYVCGYTDGTNYFRIRVDGANSLLKMRIGTASEVTLCEYEDGEDYELIYEAGVGGTINGEAISLVTSWTLGSYTMPLGCTRASDTTTYSNYWTGRIYEAKFWKDGALVSDYVPAKNSSNVYGYYDITKDLWRANSGSGTLSGGPASTIPVERKLKTEIFIPSGTVNGWNYEKKYLFDTWECVSDVTITKEDEDVNTVYVYNDDGTTLRGAYTIQNDGTIVQLTSGTSVTNRLGENKTSFIFDTDNTLMDLVKAELPSLQYNHKITFTIAFTGVYKFADFMLGMPIRFYSSEDNYSYESCLSSWEYSIKENTDEILSAKFTLGKVRKSLTSKLNKNA